MKKIVSVMLVALMMLFTAVMVVSASENAAEETMEKGLSAAENVAEEAKEAVSPESEDETEESEENETEETAEEQPGFEGVFAIAGLLAVACLVLSRRE